MSDALPQLMHGFNVVTLVYFVVLQVTYTLLAIVGWRAIEDYVRRRPMRDYQAVASSELSMPVSILVPAYNEEATIVSSVHSLLTSQFVEFEVVVINDGSSDATMAALTDAFGLVKVGRVPRSNIVTAHVRGVHASPLEPRIVVIDKANGGKADALNAGINHANYPLFCAIDADTMLDAGALSRLVWEFQAAPETVAVGGIVRIVNGSTFEDGQLATVRTPRNLLANLQIVEYLRAFLGGRIGWSKSGMLLIISGAFGLFRRDVCVAVGGYDPTTVGEDAELVVRLHRHQREQGEPCRITFFPDPICWTECPEDLRTLVRQRDRWQRGLIELIARHRRMILNPRYGRIGLIALPYFIVFELLGPAIECFGYALFIASCLLGFVSVTFAIAFFAVSLTYGLVLSFLVILMEERAFRRYPGWRDLIRLTLTAVIENVGYRQLLSFVRLRAWYTIARRRSGWGEMTRKGFGPVLSEAPVAPVPVTQSLD
ncbi:MAG TPA: glycosyltransferase [Conexibacter sp.]|jgi:cellulose synthase/poly-beta-1,6-N-acetylglucosamine synthase-like glycosyltransferase|nr:glycosyltransferase [Conexibacter sp.]